MPNSTLTSISSWENQLIPNPQETISNFDRPERTSYEREKFASIVAGDYQPFPELIDNTARSNWIKCPQLFFRSTIQELRGRGSSSIHLHAGGAFASALEHSRLAFYEHGLPAPDAERIGFETLYREYGDVELEPARNGDKSLEGLVRALESYYLEYPFGLDAYVPIKYPNGRRGIEFTFAVPIPQLVHPQTGNPILYGGRFDMLAIRKEDPEAIYVLDEKTGTSLGDQWRSQWDLDSQFTGYCWASRSYGIPVVGAVVRGIGLLKTKTTHAEAIFLRPQWEVDRWLETLQYDVSEMIRAWKMKYFRMALDKSACGAYGGCPMKTLCSSPEPSRWIESHYQVVHWNPTEKQPSKEGK